MANLNLQDKKFITPENLKLIINYGLGFASRVKNLEDKEIAPFEADKLYTKDSLTIYDGYIYKAKVTNQSSTFNEIYWDLIGDDITELTKDDIKDMLGLTTEQLTTLSSIILDSEARLDKTYSSSKIYTDIQNAIQTSKDYTLTELGKISGASYKIASSTSDMTDEKVIYLLQNSSTYDMYIVDSGTPVKIGDTTISLDDYFTKQEITDNYYDKATSDGKYALIATVDNHISDTDIHITTDERTKWNNTTDMIKVNGDVLDYIKNNPKKNLTIYWDTTDINTPYTAGFTQSGGGTLISNVFDGKWGSVIGTCGGDFLCINRLMGGIWRGWEKLCTTKVADVPKTAITWSDETNYKSSYTGCYYMVKNGICYVALDINIISESSKGVKLKDNSLPKSSFDYIHRSIPPHNSMGEALTLSVVNGVITLYNGTNGCRYLGSFSYPVVES